MKDYIEYSIRTDGEYLVSSNSNVYFEGSWLTDHSNFLGKVLGVIYGFGFNANYTMALGSCPSSMLAKITT